MDQRQMRHAVGLKIPSWLGPIALAAASATVVAVAGCGLQDSRPVAAEKPPTPHPRNAPSGFIAWPSWAQDNPLPGVDHAAAYTCWDDRLVFVIWTDFDTSAGGTSGPTEEGVYRAFLTAEQGTQVECECKTSDGVSGTLNIQVNKELTSNRPYDFEEGNLFLVSTRGASPQVTQVRREALGRAIPDPSETLKARLRELAVTDTQINRFLTGESNPSN